MRLSAATARFLRDLLPQDTKVVTLADDEASLVGEDVIGSVRREGRLEVVEAFILPKYVGQYSLGLRVAIDPEIGESGGEVLARILEHLMRAFQREPLPIDVRLTATEGIAAGEMVVREGIGGCVCAPRVRATLRASLEYDGHIEIVPVLPGDEVEDWMRKISGKRERVMEKFCLSELFSDAYANSFEARRGLRREIFAPDTLLRETFEGVLAPSPVRVAFFAATESVGMARYVKRFLAPAPSIAAGIEPPEAGVEE